MPRDSGIYDGVTRVGTITFFHAEPEALCELSRTTRKGGIVCLAVRKKYWKDMQIPDVLNLVVASGRATLKQLCKGPEVH